MKSLRPSRNAPESRAFSALVREFGSRYAEDALGAYFQGQKHKAPDPSAYTSWHTFAKDYACSKYLAKHQGTADKLSLEKKCLDDFGKIETANKTVNERIGRFPRGYSPRAVACIYAAQRKARAILGTFKTDEFVSACAWGPGATASLTARDALLDRKILEFPLACSRTALPWMKLVLSHDLHFAAARLGIPPAPFCFLPTEFQVSDSSRFTTVEKDVWARRGIDIQPTANLFLQKGLGKMVRQRLKRIGIDLDSQSRNQWLASVAHLCDFATIDLANASDTLAYQLVKLIIPPKWFAVFSALRVPSTTIGGSDVHLEKFSAMGNGFTFELESLIFYCLLAGVYEVLGIQGETLAVYGDDLVVHQSAAKACITVLSSVGFTTNVDKTYVEGRFFESCGKHYFDGIEVTPPYQKEVVTSLRSAIRAANRLWRFAARMGRGDFLDKAVLPAWTVTVAEVHYQLDWLNARRFARWADAGCIGKEPKPLSLPRQPSWVEGDDALIDGGEFLSDINGRVRFWAILKVPTRVEADNYALYANTLRTGTGDQPTMGLQTPRGTGRDVFGYRHAWRSLSQTDLGWGPS